MYAVRRFPYAAEDGLVSGPPAGMGVGGDGHGHPRYRGTARHLTTRLASESAGRPLIGLLGGYRARVPTS